MVRWNTKPFEKLFINASMDRLEKAADAIRDEAKAILRGKLKGGWQAHGVYKTGKSKGQVWTERDPGALVDTIRTVRKRGDPDRNIWIMAGNFKVWWALQTEYGRGGWRGGAKPFMRPAMRKANKQIKAILESGAGQTKGH